jgi:hypothetical protein
MDEFEVIHPDSEMGKKLGFTKKNFSGYLSLQDNTIWISAIISLNPGKHNLSHLFDKILKEGYSIKVPQPFPKMESIVKKKGFVRTTEMWEEMGTDTEVWIKECKP